MAKLSGHECHDTPIQAASHIDLASINTDNAFGMADLPTDILLDAHLAGPSQLASVLEANQSSPAAAALLQARAGSSEHLQSWVTSSDQPVAGLAAAVGVWLICQQPHASTAAQAEALRQAGRQREPQQPTASYSAILAVADAALVGLGHDLEAYNLTAQAAIAALPEGCALRDVLLTELALRLACDGRLCLLSDALDLPASDAPAEDYATSLLAPCFIDAVERGDLTRGDVLAPQVESLANGNLLLEDYLNWFARVTAGLRPDGPMMTDSQASTILLVNDALLVADRTALAGLSDRLTGDDLVANAGLASWTSLRCALALGDVELATQLLNARHLAGRHHPLVAFFQARIDALQGQLAAAAEQFSQARAACTTESLLNRLEYELQLAIELNRLSIAGLGSGPVPEAPPLSADGALVAMVAAGEELLVSEPSAPLPGDANTRQKAQSLLAGNWPHLVNQQPLPLLISGPTGTGQRELAKRLQATYQTGSQPSAHWIDCAVLDTDGCLTALCGHIQGSTTQLGHAVQAGDGVVVISGLERADLRLLAALDQLVTTATVTPLGGSEAMPCHAKLVCLCDGDPGALAQAGVWLPGLAHRLNGHRLQLTALSQQPETLAQWLNYLRESRWDTPANLTAAAVEVLLGHSWPGQLPELTACCDRLQLQGTPAIVLADDLRHAIHGPADDLDL